MKTKQLGDRLGVASATIRLWSTPEEYGAFLSDKATGGSGSTRVFDELDARIMAHVARLKNAGMNRDSISATLLTMQESNWDSLPDMPPLMPGQEPIAMIPTEAVSGRIEEIRTRYVHEIETLENRVDELEAQLDNERTQHREDIERLAKEQNDLYRQLGQLQAKLDMTEQSKDD